MQQICNHAQPKIEMNIDTVENLVHFFHSIAIGEGGEGVTSDAHFIQL